MWLQQDSCKPTPDGIKKSQAGVFMPKNVKWYGFFGHIQSPHHAHNARNETASLRGAFAFHPEEGTG
ncbi:hypothetical protein, partial [Sutterella wadsworthensis]|uniref:hypothetical protein n=1 Tax=Sutterella wadsworthensis TaxID=40545 RepID=UPI003A95DAC9